MSDIASTSANALSVQQLFSDLTGTGSTGASATDPNLFGQNLPGDPADTAKTASPGGASGSALTDQAKSKRDAALAQARLNLLGLQEQSGATKGAKGAHHHHGASSSQGGKSATNSAATTSATSASNAAGVKTGVTETAANDHSTSGLSTLLLAQLAAA